MNWLAMCRPILVSGSASTTFPTRAAKLINRSTISSGFTGSSSSRRGPRYSPLQICNFQFAIFNLLFLLLHLVRGFYTKQRERFDQPVTSDRGNRNQQPAPGWIGFMQDPVSIVVIEGGKGLSGLKGPLGNDRWLEVRDGDSSHVGKPVGQIDQRP